jgi:hypothetical protein
VKENIFVNASPTTLRFDSARSEQGWNVAESHPKVGSKLRTVTVIGADPLSERPPVITSVPVVSLMNPSSSFQNVCGLGSLDEMQAIDGHHDFPEDSRVSSTRDAHTRRHRPRGRCFDLGELQPVAPCAAKKLSKMILPKRAATKDPIYDRRYITNNGSADQTVCVLRALIPM